jgi:hypothetical protein
MAKEGQVSMSRNTRYANTETPKPGPGWCQLTDDERLTRAKQAAESGMGARTPLFSIVEAKRDGQIIVSLPEPLPPDKRGTLLLDLEAHLKDMVDQGLVVWLEPLGDRNSLRNLRGIEVKA